MKGIDREAAGQAEDFLVNSGPLNGARFSYTRTMLTNGMELVVGGYLHTDIPTVTNRELSSAELYDPATGTWMETGSMKKARSACHTLLQSNGKVLVFSGVGGRNSPATDKELYNPATGTCKEMPDEPSFDKALYNDYTDTWKLPPHHKDYE